MEAVMVEESEKMTAMRQAGPFAGVLSPKKGWEIYHSFAVGALQASSLL